MLLRRGEGKEEKEEEEEKSTTKWVKVLNSGHPTVLLKQKSRRIYWQKIKNKRTS